MATIEKDEAFKVAPLEGSSNYCTWKFSMKMVLMAKELWSIVDSTEAKPDGERLSAAWEKRTQKALAIISLSLTPTEQQHIIDCTSPKAAWDIFDKLYEGKGRNCKFMLLQELFRLKMDGKMLEYLRSVKEKVSELAAIGTAIDDDIKLSIILNGLPEKYRYLVVALEQQTKVDFDELSVRLMEEAVHHGQSGSENLAYKAIQKGSIKLKCFYCGEFGHVRNECPVREYRIKKYGDRRDAQAMFSHTATSAKLAF